MTQNVQTIVMSKTHFIVFTLSLIILTSAVLAFTIFRLNAVNQELINLSTKRFTKEARRILKGHVGAVYSLIDFQSKISSITPITREKELESHLKTVINTVEKILESYEKWVKKGKMTRKEAQKQAIDEIKLKITYYGGTGYIWINDTTEQPPKLIRHLFSLEPDAKDTGDNQKASDNQRQLFKSFVSIIEENGCEAFVKKSKCPKPGYKCPKSDMDKVSYVKLFPEWKWIIETDISFNKAIDEYKKATSNTPITTEKKYCVKKVINNVVNEEIESRLKTVINIVEIGRASCRERV